MECGRFCFVRTIPAKCQAFLPPAHTCNVAAFIENMLFATELHRAFNCGDNREVTFTNVVWEGRDTIEYGAKYYVIILYTEYINIYIIRMCHIYIVHLIRHNNTYGP